MIKTPLSTVIGGAFWTPKATILGGASKTLNQVIKSLFANNEQGFAYDPNDLTTMYRDAAGTLPVTGVGQPVGLILDKSKGLVIGSELVSAENSTFTAGTGDWVAFNSSISVVDGTLLVDASAVNGGTSLAMIGLKVGQAYVISCDARAGTSSAAQITLDYNGIVYTTKHDFTKITGVFFATRAYASVKLISGTAGTFYIDNVSVKELSGNHAYQTTSAARPILQDAPRRIDFDAIDDKLITNLPAQLTGCTVVRSVPNVGTQILTNQTIPTTYNDNTDHCGLIVINRALTATETSQITKLFNKAAGV